MKAAPLTLAMFALACQPRSAERGEDSATVREANVSANVPIISAVRPDSAVLRDGSVATVTLMGSGFDSSQEAPSNTVLFDAMSVASVRANNDGTAIRFTVPSEWRTGEAPARAIEQGNYTVRVRTSRGTSNAASLRVIR